MGYAIAGNELILAVKNQSDKTFYLLEVDIMKTELE